VNCSFKSQSEVKLGFWKILHDIHLRKSITHNATLVIVLWREKNNNNNIKIVQTVQICYFYIWMLIRNRVHLVTFYFVI